MKKLDKNQILQNIATKGKTEVAVLTTELAEIMTQLPETNDKERQALRELNRRYSASDDKTTKFSICIVGRGNLTDFNAKTVKDVMKEYNTNPETALEQGKVELVDNKPVVLDLKETFGNNIKNSNYGKPLGNSWNRNVVALVKSEEQTAYTIRGIALRGDLASTSTPEQFEVLNCNLIDDKKGLKSVKSTKFNASEETLDYNGLLQSLGKDHIVILGDAFDEAKKHKKGEEGYYDRYILTSGEFKYVNDPKNPGGNYSGKLNDLSTDKLIQVFVDGSIEKPEVEKYYTLIAQTSIKKTQRKTDSGEYVDTDEEEVVINVLGYYSS